MVGGEPKQVICDTCRSRHAHRLEPARGKQAASPIVTTASRKPTKEDHDARRKEEARQALWKELADAKSVRTFSKRERYKAGEILEHPEHGRGKIENVLRSSLLVRFRDGLKSLSML
jgi:hypothetical protein